MEYKDTDICVCGHSKQEHYEDEDPVCIDCANSGKGWDAMWHEFKLNNLKYLEQQYDRRTK